jgi:hypothetical protein
VFLTTNHGTLRLGATAFAHALWASSAPVDLATGQVAKAA